MKKFKKSSSFLTVAAAGLAGLAMGQSLGQVFQFATAGVYPPDVLLGMRQVGGASEMVVNLGSVLRFTGAPAGSTMTLTDFSPAQAAQAFSSFDQVGFTVAAGVTTESGTSIDATYPKGSLWLTRKRSNVALQSKPWNRQVQASLLPTAATIRGWGVNTVQLSGILAPDTLKNTANVLVEPAGVADSFSVNLGSGGNFLNTFQGNVENITSSTFAGGSATARSDFFQILPGTGGSTYLGFFELSPDGSLTFTAAGGVVAAPAPKITAIAQVGGATTVSFTTVAGAQYTLLKSAVLTPQPSTWTSVGSPAAGTGSTVTLSDSAPGTSVFYAVKATP